MNINNNNNQCNLNSIYEICRHKLQIQKLRHNTTELECWLVRIGKPMLFFNLKKSAR